MLTLRAVSHGYELFQPCELLLWHLYSRNHRATHWGDHVRENGVAVGWHERDARSRARIGRFLAAPYVGRFGLGSQRSFADYEDYAGISFAQRRVQDYTRRRLEPPNPPAPADWATRVLDHRIELGLGLDRLPAGALGEEATFWYFGAHDQSGREIYRSDLDTAELEQLRGRPEAHVSITRCFESEATPVSVTVIPHSASRGWLEQITLPVVREYAAGARDASWRAGCASAAREAVSASPPNC